MILYLILVYWFEEVSDLFQLLLLLFQLWQLDLFHILLFIYLVKWRLAGRDSPSPSSLLFQLLPLGPCTFLLFTPLFGLFLELASLLLLFAL
jgi:hypothetical protein